MRIKNVEQKELSKEWKETTITIIEEDGESFKLMIIHAQNRIINDFKIEPSWMGIKLTPQQVSYCLHRALDKLKEDSKINNLQEVSEEEKEKYQQIIEKVLRKINFSYRKNEQSFTVMMKDEQVLYKEIKAVLKE